MHHLTMTQMANSYQSAQSLESVKLLHDLLETPGDYDRHLVRYSSGLIFRIGYGKRVETGDEPYVRRIVEVNHTVERVASPGAYLVDTMPFLRYLPSFLAPFKEEARMLHEREIELFRSLLVDVKKEMDRGTAPQCFSKTYFENQEEYGLSIDEAAYVIGTLFEAGTGTTAAAMMSFCLCMCLHPEWQAKGQEEVDRVCGDGIPEFEDLPRLPTVRAIIKEVARWRPVTAGGLCLSS
jgi:Cytochrome P450